MAAFLLTTNPIFRSGEDCRHSKINNAQDISLPWRLKLNARRPLRLY